MWLHGMLTFQVVHVYPHRDAEANLLTSVHSSVFPKALSNLRLLSILLSKCHSNPSLLATPVFPGSLSNLKLLSNLDTLILSFLVWLSILVFLQPAANLNPPILFS